MNPLAASLEFLSPILDSPNKDSLYAAKCLGLMQGYDARWGHSGFIVRHVETTVTSDLYNPATGKKSRSFRSAGKMDVHCEEVGTGRKFIIDHKSTSEDITDPNSAYWRQLVVEGQASHYMLLEYLNGHKVDYAIWDALRKPTISPRQITKAEMGALQKDKKWFGYDCTDEEVEKAEIDKRESLSMYSKRVAFDSITERPQYYFSRRSVPRLDTEIIQYAQEQWDHGQDILMARQLDRWPRNSGACIRYGGECQFLSVCSGHDTLDSDKWKKSEWVHPELVQIAGTNGRDILTNSRIRTFQTCRKLHQYRYELGITRNEDDNDPLALGTMLHAALEIYFRALIQK